ncbi:XRE family transcriptional regulator [Nocardia sp. CDC153]|uniref:helix-turn-helix domain-containing protein n=1 Tax=Nocardia sp. CDC153 TaxID=3112167 RepID=UPI002DB8B691|nr:XRE family transcriptional regulator [Nocardia sp. CDC153]MEC3957606.1 XRE family transcriptional regulator [Nocardia sp. CDC153]
MSESEIDTGWIGRRIGKMRAERGWTLATLAARVDLSTTQLSRIESAARQPSIGTLIELARAFGVTLSELVEGEETSNHHLTRRADRVSRQIAGGEASTLSGRYPGLDALVLTLERGKSIPEARHTGEEFLCVLTGTVDLTIDTDTLAALTAGDTVHFPAHLPHTVTNTGKQTAEVLIVATHPPTVTLAAPTADEHPHATKDQPL